MFPFRPLRRFRPILPRLLLRRRQMRRMRRRNLRRLF